MKKIFLYALMFIMSVALSAQVKPGDKAVFKEYQPGYYQNSILKGINDFENSRDAKPQTSTYFALDISGFDLPNDTALYKIIKHSKAVSQGSTGTCWCFGAVSMLESEVLRTTGKMIKLSEMFVVYNQYVERARTFVRERGATYFAEGSESNDVCRMMKWHGMMPASAYSGMLPGQTVHDHGKMVEEMSAYLESVKKSNSWNEEVVVANIKTILNYHMGEPPASFDFDGKTYSPKTFVTEELKINADDYFSFMSTMDAKYNQKAELVEADNWYHSRDYYNLKIDDFIAVLVNSLENNYSACLCGDVSEPGYDRASQSAVIPTFDIPSEYIDENARQMRLYNKTTTDDHCMHVVGFLKRNQKYWFLLKDSGAGAFDGKFKGYRFISEDYVRLKMMNILVYKTGAKIILDKIIK
ncbi:MAG: peptidase C1 [Bacteroidota bacterium]